jgi:hypothetical protein
MVVRLERYRRDAVRSWLRAEICVLLSDLLHLLRSGFLLRTGAGICLRRGLSRYWSGGR